MQVFVDPCNLCGSSLPGSITSCSHIPSLLEPELLFLTNSVWLAHEERRSVEDGLAAFQLAPFQHNGWQGYELIMDDG